MAGETRGSSKGLQTRGLKRGIRARDDFVESKVCGTALEGRTIATAIAIGGRFVIVIHTRHVVVMRVNIHHPGAAIVGIHRTCQRSYGYRDGQHQSHNKAQDLHVVIISHDVLEGCGAGWFAGRYNAQRARPRCDPCSNISNPGNLTLSPLSA